jgi:RHS repeat-associated protein
MMDLICGGVGRHAARRWLRGGLVVALALVGTIAVVTAPVDTPAAHASPPAPPAAVNPAPYQSVVTTPGPTWLPAYYGVNGDEVWGPQGSPYVVTGDLSIGSGRSLTLLPGTIVKFQGTGNAYEAIDLTNQGTLYALGTPSQPVIFTSIKDDSAGGDTNGDGNTTSPAPGDWWEISSGYPKSVAYLNYIDVRYGGNPWSFNCLYGEVSTTNNTIFVLANSRLTHSHDAGLEISQNGRGYAGLFNNYFDEENCGAVSALQDVPLVVAGNTFGPHLWNESWYSDMDKDLTFRNNTLTVPTNVYSPGPGVDLRFNTMLGGAQSSGAYGANWYGQDINTEQLPACMTPTEMSAHIPRLTAKTTVSNCPAGTYPPKLENSAVLPALSAPPPGVPQAVIDAAAARYGLVDTSRGSLTYQTSDMVVQDAGKTLTATRTYTSKRSVDSDAGEGWSTSYSEALSTFAGTASLSLGDGSSLPFTTDPAAGYVPAGGVAAGYSTGAGGSTVTTTDRTGYRFDPAGELTGLLLGDPGHAASVDRSDGKVAKVTGVSGRYLSYARSSSGHVTQVADGQGRTASFAYSGTQLTGVTGANGGAESYEYDGSGRLTKVIAPSGRVLLAAGYDDSGRVAWIEEAGKGHTSFAYDPDNHKTVITRADGVQITQEYDSLGRLVRESTAGGSARYEIYDGWSRQIVEIKGVPSQPMRGYRPLATGALLDKRGDVSARVDPASRVTFATYDSAHRPLVTTYPDGATVTRAYDSDGRLTAVTDQLGKRWSYTYNGRGQVLTETNPLNEVRRLTYEPDGDLASTTDVSGAVTSYTNDDAGRPITRTGPDGHTWATSYTVWDDVAMTTAPSGAVSGREFDADRRVTALVDGENGRTTYEFDDAGRQIATVDAIGRRSAIDYDAIGLIDHLTDPRGGVRRFTYTPDGYVSSATDPAGKVTAFANDPAGRPIRITDPLGQVTQFTYDPTGIVRKTQQPDGTSTSTTLDAAGRLASQTSARGKTWSYTYDLAGRRTKTTDPLGYTRQATFDALGRPLTQTDELSRVTSTAYDDVLRTVAVTDTLGTASVTVYGPNGSVTDATDGSGRLTHYTYDIDSRLSAVTAPGGAQTTYEYDAAGRRTATVDPLGRRTVSTLDAAGQVLHMTDPAGHLTAYTYEADGHIASVTDRTGGTTTYAHDARGLVTTVTDPLGKVTTHSYDDLGRETKVVDPTGVELNTAYDPMGRPAVVWDASGAYRRRTYDLDGNPATDIDPAGITTYYYYSDRDQLTYVDWDGQWPRPEWAYTYNKAGYLATSKRPLSSVTQGYTFDQRGRLIAETDELAHTTTYGYDGAGHLTTQTTAAGKTTTSTYDAAGRLASTADPLGDTVMYGYDAADQLTTVTLPRGGVYAYTYSPIGTVATQTDPNGKVTLSFTDAEGRPTRTETPAGRTIVSRYDAAGRLWQSEAAGVVREFGYDAAGRLTSTTIDGAADTSATYDNRGLLATSTNRFGTTGYSYDSAERVAKITPPAGTPTTYTYVPAGSYIYFGPGLIATVRGPVNVNYTYDKEGHVTGKSYVSPSNSRTDAYTYGAQGRITSRREAATAATTYTYTVDGQLDTVTEPVSSGTNLTDYGYDDAGRLISQQVTQGTTTLTNEAYAWDPDGNRTSVTRGTADPVTYQYDPADRLQSSSDGAVYNYDDDGNQIGVTGPATATYGYNGFGELDTYQRDGTTISYGRDALGRTSVRSNGATAQYFGYASDGLLSSTATGTGALTSVVRGHAGEDLGQSTAGGSVQRPATNFHGDVTSWQNSATGATTATAAYDPFGSQTAVTGSPAPIAFGYQGSRTDPDSGQIDMGFRSYDPATARFTAADTIAGAFGPPIGLNRYAYAFGDPINMADPDGHWPDWLDAVGERVGEYFHWWGDQFASGWTDTTPTVEKPSWMNKLDETSVGKFINGMTDETGKAVQGATDTVLYGSACAAGAVIGYTDFCHKFDSLTTVQGWKDIATGVYEPIVDCVKRLEAETCGHAIVAAYNALATIDGAGGIYRAARSLPEAFSPTRLTEGSGVARPAENRLPTTTSAGDHQAADRTVTDSRSASRSDEEFGEEGPSAGCKLHSFDPKTRVLMADGTTRAIEDVKVGDEVKSTDPKTGASTVEPVTMLHINKDTDLTDVTVQNRASGEKTTLRTTDHHPFWDATDGKWVDAVNLAVGHKLRVVSAKKQAEGDDTGAGLGGGGPGSAETASVTVTAVSKVHGAQIMRDLTVADVHTYYVIVGETAVLVHNETLCLTPSPREPPNVGEVYSRDAEPGEEFNMVLSAGQPNTSPGAFGSFEDIPSQSYARNNLAIRSDWKADVSYVQRYRFPSGEPIRIQQSMVGPQYDSGSGRILVGGAQQLEILNRSDLPRLIPVGDPRPLRP